MVRCMNIGNVKKSLVELGKNLDKSIDMDNLSLLFDLINTEQYVRIT